MYWRQTRILSRIRFYQAKQILVDGSEKAIMLMVTDFYLSVPGSRWLSSLVISLIGWNVVLTVKLFEIACGLPIPYSFLLDANAAHFVQRASHYFACLFMNNKPLHINQTKITALPYQRYEYNDSNFMYTGDHSSGVHHLLETPFEASSLKILFF